MMLCSVTATITHCEYLYFTRKIR